MARRHGRFLLLGPFILLAIAMAGCYTVIRHPVVEPTGEYTRANFREHCLDCHHNYHHFPIYYYPRYHYYPSYSAWRHYYGYPWWWDTWYRYPPYYSDPEPPEGEETHIPRRRGFELDLIPPTSNGGSSQSDDQQGPQSKELRLIDNEQKKEPKHIEDEQKKEPKYIEDEQKNNEKKKEEEKKPPRRRGI